MTMTPVARTSTPAADDCGCPDFGRAGMSRRSLLKTSAVLGGGMAMTQMFGEAMMQASFGGTAGGNTLVVISLRGGIDGMGMVVPYADQGYYTARPHTAVPASQLICKDSTFGLHPKMAPLQKYWSSGELAAVQAVGLPVANRSHFSAIEEVEDAAPGSSLRSGWINRMVGVANTSGTHSNPQCLDAVQLGMNFPTTALGGDAPTLATTDLSGLQLSGLDADYVNQRYSSLATAWAGATGPLANGNNEAVAISKGPGKTLKAMADNPAVTYPTVWNAAPFAAPLKSAAKLIRAKLGTDVIAIDAGNWDLHTNYGNLSGGTMQSNIDGLAQALAAFLDDLGTDRQRVTVVTLTEFGRRVTENGSQGFDHGWGTMMLLAGAGVKGGQYYGTWPGLDATALADGDLKVTTDYRTVLTEIVQRRFSDRSTAQMFPGFTGYSPLGFMS
jgi:uncharacterized protein (DUF1501 family)